MVYSEVTSHVEKTHNVSTYGYDALGRRTITQSVTGQTLRTVYDGLGFEVIREGETFRDGSLTTQYTSSVTARAGNIAQSNMPTGERYRWISEDGEITRTAEEGYEVQNSRYGGRGVTLYGNGEAVAVSYGSSSGSRSVYLGKDVLGSVRTATTDTGSVEDRYEYDAFGSPYKGDLSGAMNLGYTGKPYEAATGLYNYGFRDYRSQTARFTTVDPVRDGSNWFSYVNNDPVNYLDLWGLAPIFANDINGRPVVVRASTKNSTTIEIKRNGNEKERFSDTLKIKIGNQTLLRLPVQSTADIQEPRLTQIYNGRTLAPGTYTGILSPQSGSYLNAILIEHPDFFIHPNTVTVPAKRVSNDAETPPINNGPYLNTVSAGCQVLLIDDFNTLTDHLKE